MEHINIVNFNTWTKNHITDDNKFDDDGFIIMENNNNYKSTGILLEFLKTIGIIIIVNIKLL